MFTAALHPAGLQPPPAFTVTIATTWVYQGFEGKGGQGLSSVQWRNQICSLPRQQLWRLMSSRRGVCGASCLGAAVTRAKICCPHPLWRRLSLTDLETFLSAESRRFFFVFFFICLRECLETSEAVKCWIYSRVLSVSPFAVCWFVSFCLFSLVHQKRAHRWSLTLL